MKSLRMNRIALAALATMALLAGCGESANLTAAGPSFDTTPPPAPDQLVLSQDDLARPALTWEVSAAADVMGYQVYVYSPSPERDNAYVLASESMVTSNWFPFNDAGKASGVYRVRAVDAAGNISAMSASVTVPDNVTPHGARDPIAYE